ncbi:MULTISPECIES: hypothetical protein [Niastella]|uniref:Uncharacterized protein n=1 Tax=Niastella soli TaxID=2821487 RepID=A0ABS3YXZ1_9BACT|nr:hypothetical protein [Niastella soli]MBO9202789.1 hypothetical protein [Niastella soli]
MKNMLLFALGLNIVIPTKAVCQKFEKKEISKEERSKGLILKFQAGYREKVENLKLFSDSTFLYEVISMAERGFSKGNWVRRNGVLILSNPFKENNVPVIVNFTYDTSLRGVKFKMDDVKSSKGEIMSEAMICVNADSIKCIPLLMCNTDDIDSITKVKLVFGQGMSSKWIAAPTDPFNVISITVQSDFDLSSFLPFNRKFKYNKMSLIEVK